jgi:hypothetical protein
MAFLAGWASSAATTGTYTIQSTAAATPVISPSGGRLASGRTVRVYSPEAGAVLRYTTTGLDPAETDPIVASGAPLVVSRSMRLKLRAWKSGLVPSLVASADFDVVGAVAAGAYFTVALKSDGTVRAWGQGDFGQLGNGSTARSFVPVTSSISGVAAIAAGTYHVVALKADGTVWCWGRNDDGQLGFGSGGHQSSPVQTVTATGALTGVIAVAAGASHSVALRSDGTVWVWGSGYYGQTGMGDASVRTRAVQVPGLSGVTAVAAGALHTLALQSGGGTEGTLWGWGYNADGELADGSTVNRSAPVVLAEHVTLAAAGGVQTFLVKADGSVWGSGSNNHAQLGNATTASPQLTLTPALSGVTAPLKLAATGVHTLALTSESGVVATGFNNKGQVGDGTTVDKSTPVPVVLLRDVVDIGAGPLVESIYVSTTPHSVALTGDGQVWTWGSNVAGELGNGGTASDDTYRPRPVTGLNLSDRTWPDGDPDGDGLTSEEELQVGTDPFNADTNGDGVSDRVAIRSGVSATSLDVDADGVSNAVELQKGTDPLAADTDGDGVSDATDCFPRDPTRSTCPVPVPGDQSPPVITLTEPASAVLLTSVP